MLKLANILDISFFIFFLSFAISNENYRSFLKISGLLRLKTGVYSADINQGGLPPLRGSKESEIL